MTLQHLFRTDAAYISEPIIADAKLDRIIHNAYSIYPQGSIITKTQNADAYSQLSIEPRFASVLRSQQGSVDHA